MDGYTFVQTVYYVKKQDRGGALMEKIEGKLSITRSIGFSSVRKRIIPGLKWIEIKIGV